MTKRRKLTKAQEHLKQRILTAYRRPYGFSHIPPNWGDKLWKKSTSDIHEFIEDRFRDTLDAVEYYSAMVLLWKTIPEKELLVEFHESPQWKNAAKTYQDCAGACNHLSEKKAVNRTKQTPAEMNSIKATRIKPIVPIQFIGDQKQ